MPDRVDGQVGQCRLADVVRIVVVELNILIVHVGVVVTVRIVVVAAPVGRQTVVAIAAEVVAQR